MGLMNRIKVLVLLTLCLFVLMLLVSPQFTGWFVDTFNIDIGIRQGTQGCLHDINDTGDVNFGGQKSFYFHIENCGNQVMNGTINLVIANIIGTVHEVNSSYYSLDPMETFIFNYTWVTTGQPAGNYFAYAKDNYTNETVQLNITFSVKEGGVPDEPGGPGGAPGAPIIRYANFTVDAPANITAYSGSNQTVLIRVTNNGQVTITDLLLRIIQGGVPIDTAPVYPLSIAVNSSVLFLVEIDARGMKAGEYEMLWEVAGGGVLKSGTIRIDVIESSDEIECRESIVYYLEIMDTLKEQVDEAEARNMNVSYAKQLLDEITYELVAAQTYYKIESHGDCVDRMDTVRDKVRIVVDEIAKVTREPTVLVFPVSYQVVLWSVVVVVLVMVLFILFRFMRKRIKRTKLSLPRKWS